MPRFTRHAYELVSEVLTQACDCTDLYDRVTLERLATEFSILFATDNPRFDARRFRVACGLLPDEPDAPGKHKPRDWILHAQR